MPLEDQIPELKQEHRDLLTLLRAAINGTLPASPPANWPALLDIARLHLIDMFLYPAVANWPADLQPAPELMSRWKSAFFGAVMKYESASAQLKEILQALHKADVPVIPLKGAWLAEKIYEYGAMRPMCDFDLLVPLKQLNQARAALEQLGYTTPDHYFDTTRNKDIHYAHPDRPMVIELHFRIWHEGQTKVDAPDTDRLWVDPVVDTLHGIPILAFPPERQLIYLSRHILQHSLNIPIKAYIDLILLCRKYALDPALLKCESQTMRVPFGAKFIITVAMDLGNERPSKPLATFLLQEEHMSERQSAFLAILTITSKSSQLTPEREAYQKAPFFQRLHIGISRLFLNPNRIKQHYTKTVKRFGLIGGYISRADDLIRRRNKDWKSSDKPQDLANFNMRHQLSQWIQDRNKRYH